MEASAARGAPRVVVLGWGNPARGDDALGPQFIEQLQAHTPGPGWPALRLIAAHQLQVEHALDLQGCDLALFIDAALDMDRPYAFRPVPLAPARQWSTHAAEPADVLSVYERTMGEAPPPAFSLEIGARDFEFGQPLSPVAQINLGLALAFVERLLETLQQAGEPSPAAAR